MLSTLRHTSPKTQINRPQDKAPEGTLKKANVSNSKANSNHFTVDSHRQKHLHSCAAACLFFAIRNFSLKRNHTLLAELNSSPQMAQTCPYYDKNSLLHFCNETDIYKITSGFHGDVFEVNPGTVFFPHNVVLAAKNFGLETEVYIAPGICSDGMRDDPTLEEPLRLLETAATINTCTVPPLKENEFAMHLCFWVDSSKDQLVFTSWEEICHWIISRPDGTIMEPGVGENFASLSEFNANSQFRLLETGVSIVLKNGTANQP